MNLDIYEIDWLIWLNQKSAYQGLTIIFLLSISYLFYRSVSQNIKQHKRTLSLFGRLNVQVVRPLLFSLCSAITFGFAVLVAQGFNLSLTLVEGCASIFLAWSIINFVAAFHKGPLVTFIRMFVGTIVALHLLDVLQPITRVLDGIGFSVGATWLSVFKIIKGIIILILLMWLTSLSLKIVTRQLGKTQGLSPSLKVLFEKILKIVFYFMAVFICFNTVGLDLTTLTVFSGAIGVGLGFGLQRIVANFISGIILLSDHSIKPGDVITVGTTYGWVNSLGARYVSVITRDGKEHLIPNESLITEKVENWSFSKEDVRLRLSITVSYDSDIELAADLIEQSATSVLRVLSDPAPTCLLKDFADKGVEMELRCWIKDPSNGTGSLKSEILFNVWHAFKAHGIKIPYPARELYINNR